jgi:hypothetical protein
MGPTTPTWPRSWAAAPDSEPRWVGDAGDRIGFQTAPSSRDGRNLLRDGRHAISITDHYRPFTMASVPGVVVERLDADPAWDVIDRIPRKYTGEPYPRGEDHVAFLVERRAHWAHSD